MDLTSFHLFSKLPSELRNEIWVAALPQPRLVQIQEEEATPDFDEEDDDDDMTSDNEDFFDSDYGVDRTKNENIIELAKKNMASLGADALNDPAKTCADLLAEITGYKTDRMLQRFRYIWSERRPWDRNQKQLEDYGFTTVRTKPSIPPLLLLEVGGLEALHDATRESYFWSRTPIPALLHTCRESRHAMQLCGYELAFAAEKSEPRIWFNFKHDVLYLTSGRWGSERNVDVFDTGPWNIYQLPRKDRGRIEKLAFEDRWEGQHHLVDAVPRFRRLKELLWVVYHIPADYEARYLGKYKYDTSNDEWGHIETEADLWGYLECDSMEFIDSKVIAGYLSGYCGDCMGGSCEMYSRGLKGYRRRNGGSSEGYFTLKTTELLFKLREHKMIHPGSWSIPTTKIVFVLTKKQAGLILDGRERFVQKMREVEIFENEQGPRSYDRFFGPRRRSLDAPFVDECEVLDDMMAMEY
ncbi:uncharacterized protein PAC_04515 [Phialocephala subalpina]|uniref:2EXR domain-containing protein n=1 Tax=Phialocephala subalpina TaxID=576137 RepID=A0A1L7WPH3_9HELO|nr:uncharacterized protein PAC_04515 [Phialocephala subalpina]